MCKRQGQQRRARDKKGPEPKQCRTRARVKADSVGLSGVLLEELKQQTLGTEQLILLPQAPHLQGGVVRLKGAGV